MDTRSAKVLDGGRVILPADFRRKMGVKDGDPVTIWVDEETREFRIRTLADHIKWVQQDIRRYVPEGVSLVDELIADRRAEAQNE